MSTGFLQRMRREEKGTFILLMALCLLGIFGFAALSIDIGHVYQQKRDMQCAADFAALAGSALLTNQPLSRSAIIQAAQAIAQSNGLSSTEIAAGDTGAIQVGTWDIASQTFTPDASASDTTTLTWNAVRVPAKRTVGLIFGKLTILGGGFSAMSPAVHAVAMQSFPNQAYGPSPFMLRSQFATNAFGVTFRITQQEYQDTGNKGPLNLDNPSDYDTEMTNGCSCTLTIGQTVTETKGNGNPSPHDMLTAAVGDTIVMPIIGDNNGVITGFAVVYVVDTDPSNGKGSWYADLKILDQIASGGSGSGGSNTYPYAMDRILVQ